MWFKKKSLSGDWYSLEELNARPYAEPISRYRKVRQGKLIYLGAPHQQGVDSILLIISVGNPQREFNVTMEILPSHGRSALPKSLLCKIIDEFGECIEEEKSNHNTPSISLEIGGEEGELFSIVIQYKGFEHRENFAI